MKLNTKYFQTFGLIIFALVFTGCGHTKEKRETPVGTNTPPTLPVLPVLPGAPVMPEPISFTIDDVPVINQANVHGQLTIQGSCSAADIEIRGQIPGPYPIQFRAQCIAARWSATFSGLENILEGTTTFSVTANLGEGTASASASLFKDSLSPLATIDSNGLGVSPSGNSGLRRIQIGGADVSHYKAVHLTSNSCQNASFLNVPERATSEFFEFIPTINSNNIICAIGRDAYGNYQQLSSASSVLFILIPIGSVEDLNIIRANPSGRFALTQDLDLAGINFQPIGDHDAGFTGSIDGQGFRIRNLQINLEQTNETGPLKVGFFNKLNGSASNLRFENVNIQVACSRDSSWSCNGILAGGLAGSAEGNIENVQIAGGIIRGHGTLGGIIGQSLGTIRNSSSDLSIIGASLGSSMNNCDGFKGGIVGDYWGNLISNSHSTGSINNENCYGSMGGIAGRILNFSNPGIRIENTFSSTELQVANSGSAGGLVGWMSCQSDCQIDQAFSTGNISGGVAGGLIGQVFPQSSTSTARLRITRSYSERQIRGENNPIGGGLIGSAASIFDITDSYSISSIQAQYAGGLVGQISVSSQIAANINIRNSIFYGSALGQYHQDGVIGFIDRLVNVSILSSQVFWDSTENPELSSSAFGTSRTTAELRSAANYNSSWLNSIWNIQDGFFAELVSLPNEELRRR